MKFFLMAILAVQPMFAWANELKEEANQLIQYVASIQGAVFIRNGSEHSAKDAADHIRLKWEKQEKKIQSTEIFIERCASKSSISGERYVIRFSDGTTRFCDELLFEKLKSIRKTDNKMSPTK